MPKNINTWLQSLGRYTGDRSFNNKFTKTSYPEYLIYIGTIVAVLITIIFIYYIFSEAYPTFQREGINFILGSDWDYTTGNFGILDMITGTLFVTIVTLVMACPLGILTAIYLAEFAPAFVYKLLTPLIELLIGIPSVVYGYFGAFVLYNYVYHDIKPFLGSTLGFIPIFRNVAQTTGGSILLASMILAVMVLPTIVVLSQQAMRSTPREYYEASVSLGATRWETIKKVVIPVSSSGIITAILLATMRAMGETMAVVMLMGNNLHLPTSILDTGFTMTSKIVIDITYRYPDDMARSALMGIAAVLFILELIILLMTRAVGARLK